MSQAQIVTGAHVLTYINGQRFGKCDSFVYSASTPSKEIGGIDCVELVELAPTTSRCNFTMGVWRLIGDGGAQGAGLMPAVADLARGKYFSVMLIEITSKTILFQADFCRVENQNWTKAVKQMSHGTIACKALSWSNEVKPLKR